MYGSRTVVYARRKNELDGLARSERFGQKNGERVAKE